MKFFTQLLSLAIFGLIVCVSWHPLEAAEKPRIPSPINNLESRFSKTEETLDNLQRSFTETGSFLDEKQADLFYLDSALAGKTADIEASLDEKEAGFLYLDSAFADKTTVEEDGLCKDIGALKDRFLNDKKARPGTLIQLTNALIKLGKNKEAVELCENFSDRYPVNKTDTIELYYLIGSSFQDSQDYDEAIECYRKGLLYIDKGSFASRIRICLGWCHYKKGEYDKAIKEYTGALREGFLGPDAIQWAYLEIGRCHFFLKNYEDAIGAFKQALKINPNTKLAKQTKANIEDIEKLKNGGAS